MIESGLTLLAFIGLIVLIDLVFLAALYGLLLKLFIHWSHING